MCGILGLVGFERNNQKSIVFDELLQLSCRRGTDAAGVVVFGKTVPAVLYKSEGSGKKLLKSCGYVEKVLPKIRESEMIIGQTRLATNGSPSEPKNNQPVRVEDLFLVHNGIVVNSRELARKYRLDEDDSDSRVLAKSILIEAKRLNSLEKALTIISAKVAGTYNLIVAWDRKENREVCAVTNNGTLYIGQSDEGVVLASERFFLIKVNNKLSLGLKISKVVPGTGVVVDRKGISRTFMLKNGVVSKEMVVKVAPSAKLLNHKLSEAIKKIPRCSKCLLPTSTPFISFDKHGVCNYCQEHEKISYGKESDLTEMIKKYRRDDGRPDCLLAFSGGRDSAFGLHYLVKKMGMHPVAVTFDWGMVSDIGRRNQARLLGKLGVEHIIISADLKKVRNDIRKNLVAWLRKPDLGMVPLLMQADKVTEYYVDVIKKELGVDAVIFCRGNELEREEFKAGYCGVKNADPGGVIHHYAVADKIRILFYYAKQFITNPGYWNTSLWSSFLGYLITYVVPHDYIYLWHHLRWDEKEIVDTLRNEYGWEDDGENEITWRIDDGSPAFYNYLYAQIQGFTENDSFRSRQIREGIMTRSEALKIVERENRPRYSAMQWYFDKIGLDGDWVLGVIDSVKKKY
jgi:predicted glutamine amidotransferase